MPLTDDQRADLVLLREADSHYQEALTSREDNLKAAVTGGAPFDDIGRVLGVSGRAVARLAQRRGWHTPREYHRRG